MGRCISPFLVRDKITGATTPAPCGKCPDCIAKRVSGWSFRLVQEDKQSLMSLFVTLTYAPEFVPNTKNKFMTLDKKHVQNFMKLLRYYSPSFPKIKYYAAGEYGSEGERPHYHIILFNANYEAVERAWSMGAIYFGTVTAASVGYSLKYISKKGKIPVHSRDDRLPEFALMSKGLGKNYLTEQMVRWHNEDLYNRMYLPFEGKKLSMPRYYKEKLYTKEQREHIGAHLAGKLDDELQRKIQDYGPEYYRDKAEADKAAIARKEYRARKTDKL